MYTAGLWNKTLDVSLEIVESDLKKLLDIGLIAEPVPAAAAVDDNRGNEPSLSRALCTVANRMTRVIQRLANVVCVLRPVNKSDLFQTKDLSVEQICRNILHDENDSNSQ